MLRGSGIDDAYRRTLALAGQPVAPTPGRETLDELLSLFAGAPALV